MKVLLTILGLIATVGILKYGYKCHMDKQNQLNNISVEDMEKWVSWRKEFGKSYKLGLEQKRIEAFLANDKIIEEHNAKGETYTLGHNQFSDLSREEFASTYLRPMTPKNDEEKNIVVLSTESLPAAVDWRAKGAVNAIQNQGQCGSCWAFSAVAAMEGAHFLKHGKLLKLAEQQLLDCDKVDQACNGGLMDNAFKFAEKNEMVLESKYPYKAKKSFWGCKAKKYKGQMEVSTYADVTPKSEQQLMAAVAQQPVSIAIEADQSTFQLYKSGVFTGACGASLDHGVAVVGYGTDAGKDFWIVRNSWAATWGEKGYMKMERGVASVNAGKGECGILSEPSWPTAQ